MSDWAPKRFWKTADAVEVDHGYSVALDGRAVKTPAKNALCVPSLELAKAIAEEWDAQDKTVEPDTMPLTRLANSAVDKVATQHAEVADLLAEYGASDLICYRATGPDALIARQSAAWDSFLDWARQTLDIDLVVQTGVMPIDQPVSSVQRIKELTHQFDAFALTAFHELVSLSGSWVIGMYAMRESVDIDTLWTAAIVDDLFQAEKWGDDDEALEMRALKQHSFSCANRFSQLCRGGIS